MLPRLLPLLAVISAVVLAGPCVSQTVTTQARQYAALQTYGQIPLAFEPNVGQSSPMVKFLSRGRGYNLFLTDKSVVVAGSVSKDSLSIEFVGANPSATSAGIDLQPGKTNYLRGRDPSKWLRNVPTYSAVEYRSLYRGIDARFYGNESYFEHDFVVAPGANPAQIKLLVHGDAKLALARSGDVDLVTGSGKLTLKRPYVYQQEGTRTRKIRGSYTLSGRTFGIRVGQYDKRKPLIIDPVIVYSTYIAGSKSDSGVALAVDAAGSAYITGLTSSPDFPTASPLQQNCNNCTNSFDAFITKLNATGTGLVYSTFLGGSDFDEAKSIAVDASGDAIVTGRTSSTDFPLASPIVTPPPSIFQTNAFVTSLKADGSGFNYSTYVGGSDNDFAHGVAVDNAGNAYVTGLTQSADFPVTPGTRPPVAPPSFHASDVFVVKISQAGALQYGLTIHGEATPGASFANSFSVDGIAVDAGGDAYLTGRASAGWPTTAGSFQPNFNGTPNNQTSNAFIAKLNATASDFVYSTYLGGTGSDWGKAIALDQDGNAYVTGDTSSPNFPTTPGAFQTNTENCCRTFVTKLNSIGSALVYSSLLSGSGPSSFFNQMIAFGIAVDSSGSAYAIGRTNSRTFPIVNPFQAHLPSENRQFGDGVGIYLSKFNSTGTALLFSTYFGGSTGTEGLSVAVNPVGTEVYITGTSFDQDLPTTPGAFQRTILPPPPFTSSVHAFVAKFDLSVPAAAACLNPRFLTFFSPLHVPSFPNSTTLKNCGSAPLLVSNVSTTAPFSTSNTCSTPIAPGDTCSISVTFTPTQAGATNGLLEVFDNSAVSPQQIRLQGVGEVPVVELFNSFLFLDNQLLGTTSLPRSVIVVNVGGADLHISAIEISGDFSQTNDCNMLVPANFACTIRVSFTPTAIGVRTGTIKIFDDAEGSPHSVVLQGTGFGQVQPPSVNVVVPPAVELGSSLTTLRIKGQDFFQNSVVRLDGVALPTTYVDDHTLTATVNPAVWSQVAEKSVTVSTPGPGGGLSAAAPLNVYRTVNLKAADLISDRISGKLFASVPNGAPSFANTVVAIDPNTGQIGPTIPIGTDPRKLAVSDNGQFLYVAVRGEHLVRRINLSTMTVDLSISLEGDPVFGPVNAADIKVVPGSARAIVVAREGSGSPNGRGLVVFDDAVKRPSEITLQESIGSKVLAFTSNPGFVYEVGGQNLFEFTLNNSGLSLGRTSSLLSPGGVLAADASRLYNSTGKIFDPATFALVPPGYVFQTPLPFSQVSVIPETAVGRTYFFTGGHPDDIFEVNVISTVVAFDQQTLGKTGAVNIPDLSHGRSLVRWGSDGFAWAENDDVFGTAPPKIIILKSSLVRTGIATGPLNITQLTLARGNSSPPINFTVSVPAGSSGPVSLTCSGLPLGASCSFTPASSVSPAFGSPASATATIHVPRFASTGDFNVLVNATAGSQVSSKAVSLSVNDFDIQMSTSERTAFPGQSVSFEGSLTHLFFYNQNVALACSAGATPAPSACTVSPATGVPISETPFSVIASASQAQEYIFNITGVGIDTNSTSRSQTLILHVADFALGTFSQVGTSVVAGGVSSATVFQVQPIGPFAAPVTLECLGVPAGANCSFNGQAAPAILALNRSALPIVLVLTASQAVAPGDYPLVIRATTASRPAGPITAPFQLTVTAGVGTTDLAIGSTVPAEPTMVGTPASLTITASNGGNAVSSASITVSFVSPVFVESASIPGGTCAGTGAMTVLITCAAGSLGSGSSKELLLNVIPGFTRTVTGTATVSSSASEGNLADNFRAIVVDVRPRPFARRGLPIRRP